VAKQAYSSLRSVEWRGHLWFGVLVGEEGKGEEFESEDLSDVNKAVLHHEIQLNTQKNTESNFLREFCVY